MVLKLQSHWDADWHAARGLSKIAEIGNPHQTVSNHVFSSTRCAYTPRRTKHSVRIPYKSPVSVCIVYERGLVHTHRRWRTHTARGVRTPPTVRVHSCTLPTVSLHLRTLPHGNRRMETVWRDRDTWRRCVYAHRTSTRKAYTTRRSAYT